MQFVRLLPDELPHAAVAFTLFVVVFLPRCYCIVVIEGQCTALDLLSTVPHKRIDLIPSLYTFSPSLPLPNTFTQLENSTADTTQDTNDATSQRSAKRQRTNMTSITSDIPVEKEVLLQELYEWLGAVSCRLETCLYDINLESASNPFRTVPLCPHTTFTAAAAESEQAKASEETAISSNQPFNAPVAPFTLTWHGMLSSQHIIQAVQWAR